MFTVRDAVRNNTGAAGQAVALRADQPHRHAACRRLLHPARGPDRLSRRLAARGRITARSMPGKPQRLHLDRRLARLYRQILADRADPAAGQAVKARFTHRVEGGVDRYQADYLGAAKSPCRPTARRRRRCRFFAGAKEVNLLDAYDDIGHPAVRPRDRFRLVLFPDQADLSDPAVLLRAVRQFRAGDPAADPAASSCSSSRSPTNPTRR